MTRNYSFVNLYSNEQLNMSSEVSSAYTAKIKLFSETVIKRVLTK